MSSGDIVFVAMTEIRFSSFVSSHLKELLTRGSTILVAVDFVNDTFRFGFFH